MLSTQTETSCALFGVFSAGHKLQLRAAPLISFIGFVLHYGAPQSSRWAFASHRSLQVLPPTYLLLLLVCLVSFFLVLNTRSSRHWLNPSESCCLQKHEKNHHNEPITKLFKTTSADNKLNTKKKKKSVTLVQNCTINYNSKILQWLHTTYNIWVFHPRYITSSSIDLQLVLIIFFEVKYLLTIYHGC